MSVLYHPDKANVVADALSRMSMGSFAYVPDGKRELGKEVHRLTRLGFRLEYFPKESFMVYHNSKSSLAIEVKSNQYLDLLLELKELVLRKSNESFSQGGWST